MPQAARWTARFLIAWALIFALLLMADSLQSEPLDRAWPSALAWGAVSSALFIGARLRAIRRGAPCPLCDRIAPPAPR